MINHFNTYDVYQHSEFNIYPAEDMYYLDKLHSYCRYKLLEYLIDYNIIKHMAVNTDGYVYILHLKLQGLWASMCADFSREFIEKLDIILFNGNTAIRDYIWFLKQNKEEAIDVYVVIFGDREILAKLDIIA